MNKTTPGTDQCADARTAATLWALHLSPAVSLMKCGLGCCDNRSHALLWEYLHAHCSEASRDGCRGNRSAGMHSKRCRPLLLTPARRTHHFAWSQNYYNMCYHILKTTNKWLCHFHIYFLCQDSQIQFADAPARLLTVARSGGEGSHMCPASVRFTVGPHVS